MVCLGMACRLDGRSEVEKGRTVWLAAEELLPLGRRQIAADGPRPCGRGGTAVSAQRRPRRGEVRQVAHVHDRVVAGADQSAATGADRYHGDRGLVTMEDLGRGRGALEVPDSDGEVIPGG